MLGQKNIYDNVNLRKIQVEVAGKTEKQFYAHNYLYTNIWTTYDKKHN